MERLYLILGERDHEPRTGMCVRSLVWSSLLWKVASAGNCMFSGRRPFKERPVEKKGNERA